MVYSYNVILHKPNYIQQNGWHSQRQYWMNEARLKYILHNFNFRNFKSKLNRNQDSCYIGEGRGTENDWEHKQMRLLEFWCFLIWVLLIWFFFFLVYESIVRICILLFNSMIVQQQQQSVFKNKHLGHSLTSFHFIWNHFIWNDWEFTSHII